MKLRSQKMEDFSDVMFFLSNCQTQTYNQAAILENKF